MRIAIDDCILRMSIMVMKRRDSPKPPGGGLLLEVGRIDANVAIHPNERPRAV